MKYENNQCICICVYGGSSGDALRCQGFDRLHIFMLVSHHSSYLPHSFIHKYWCHTIHSFNHIGVTPFIHSFIHIGVTPFIHSFIHIWYLARTTTSKAKEMVMLVTFLKQLFKCIKQSTKSYTLGCWNIMWYKDMNSHSHVPGRSGRSTTSNAFIHSFIHPYWCHTIHSFILVSHHSFIHIGVTPFIHSYWCDTIHSFIHIGVTPFIHSFIHSLIFGT
jgi:hypothetical protein